MIKNIFNINVDTLDEDCCYGIECHSSRLTFLPPKGGLEAVENIAQNYKSQGYKIETVVDFTPNENEIMAIIQVKFYKEREEENEAN